MKMEEVLLIKRYSSPWVMIHPMFETISWCLALSEKTYRRTLAPAVRESRPTVHVMFITIVRARSLSCSHEKLWACVNVGHRKQETIVVKLCLSALDFESIETGILSSYDNKSTLCTIHHL
jgi:hypothetical protein